MEKENKTQQGFMEESNYKNRIMVFHDRLKRHLSAEMISETEKKDTLTRELVERKFELEQKDLKLFKNVEQKDTRQFFSPLNLARIDESQKDERLKQLAADIHRLELKIDECNDKITEIEELLDEIEGIQNYSE